ncbi:uncharacterized protein CTRU02_202559 [Colletotrichum truncatum]|uniref:Integral membrane protein n=1 Tax=Colletotrichum truncatum TaxID=5467 RepID=A0ACC3ZKK7_COLTU|nr:uncharacterized protein CTRU02_01727 [Colletotrichum truncatum]KAF6800048.1 integral membrane protein [Colletotrichum truncatum]
MPLDQPAPPFYALREDDKAALVVVTSLIFLIYAVVGIILKLVIRLNITSLKSHDVLLLASLLLLFMETILVIAACNRGLGRHQDTVGPEDLTAFHKLFYASSLLATAVAGTTKLSLCLLIQSINSYGRLHLANRILFGVIAAWMVSVIIAEAFQCSLPDPWFAISQAKCPGREAIFLYNGIMDIITDVTLCLLPVAMVWKVQTSTRRKLLVISLFGSRIIVPILSISGLVSTQRFASNYSDSTWYAVPYLIWLQCSLGLSVLTACVPSLKGVIDSLMGTIAVAAIQAPYQLTSSGADEASRLHATAIGGGTSPRYGPHLTSGASNSRATRTRSLRPSDWSKGGQTQAHEGKEKEDGTCSDSVRKLTESDEDLAHQGHERRSSSHAGSLKSSEARYRM